MSRIETRHVVLQLGRTSGKTDLVEFPHKLPPEIRSPALPAKSTITIRHFVDRSIRIDTYLGCEYHAGHYVSCCSVFNNLFAYLLTFVDHLQSPDASFCSARYIWG